MLLTRVGSRIENWKTGVTTFMNDPCLVEHTYRTTLFPISSFNPRISLQSSLHCCLNYLFSDWCYLLHSLIGLLLQTSKHKFTFANFQILIFFREYGLVQIKILLLNLNEKVHFSRNQHLATTFPSIPRLNQQIETSKRILDICQEIT